MTDLSVLRAEAARARASAAGIQRASLPLGESQREDIKFASEFRGETVEKDGQQFYMVEGYASMTERAYEMWDQFGPYEEIVSARAFDKTLAEKPMVVFRFNHAGTPMATTANGRLEIEADAMGLRNRAWINPKRADVQDLITAIEDRDVTEQSFMFQINDGEWNDDFTQFRINEVSLERGDVGPVTYGANPYTLIAARAGEFLSAIPDMPVLAAREAMKRLAARADLAPVETPAAPVEAAPATPEPAPAVERAEETPQVTVEPTAHGSSIRLRLAQLEVDKQHQ